MEPSAPGPDAFDRRLATAEARIDNLEAALVSARHIGCAIGILMTSRRVTEADAFTLLARTSQRDHRKLREVADDVVLTGQLPEPRHRPARTARHTCR